MRGSQVTCSLSFELLPLLVSPGATLSSSVLKLLPVLLP